MLDLETEWILTNLPVHSVYIPSQHWADTEPKLNTIRIYTRSSCSQEEVETVGQSVINQCFILEFQQADRCSAESDLATQLTDIQRQHYSSSWKTPHPPKTEIWEGKPHKGRCLHHVRVESLFIHLQLPIQGTCFDSDGIAVEFTSVTRSRHALHSNVEALR